MKKIETIIAFVTLVFLSIFSHKFRNELSGFVESKEMSRTMFWHDMLGLISIMAVIFSCWIVLMFILC